MSDTKPKNMDDVYAEEFRHFVGYLGAERAANHLASLYGLHIDSFRRSLRRSGIKWAEVAA